MPTPHTGTALSLSHLYSTRFYSTRFYSLTTSTAIATSTSIFTTAPQTDHVPYSQKSNSREDTAVRTTAHNYQAFATHRSHDRTNATTTLS